MSRQTVGFNADALIESGRIVALAESALAAPAASYGGVEFYPHLHQKAAILYSRLVRNHPLPDGNKRVAFICMNEFLERNGSFLNLGPADDAERVSMTLELVASDQIFEHDFVEWVRIRLIRIAPEIPDSAEPAEHTPMP
ncbi:MAG TPA: Fic family protein [Candidatus Dormibacteraeota bacterium]